MSAATEARSDNNLSGFVTKAASASDEPGGPAAFTSVAATWKQPAVTCPAENARVAIWIGLDTKTVERVGTVAICEAGKPVAYHSFSEMLPGTLRDSKGPQFEVSLLISPGDTIAASARYQNGRFELELRDLTDGGHLKTTRGCNRFGATCDRSSAEWIVERSGGYPLANYTAVEFTNIEVGSETATTTIRYDMVDKATNHALSTCRVNGEHFPPPDKTIRCDRQAAE